MHKQSSAHHSATFLRTSTSPDVLPAGCLAARFDNGLKLWLPNIAQPRPNLAAFQVTAAVPSSFDLVLLTQPEGDTASQRLAALSGMCCFGFSRVLRMHAWEQE
jgi:hypothetical protein